MGASVTNLAGGEIFQALQSGALDAAEFVGPYNDLALGFYQVCKHYYTSSFNEPGLATEVVVDKAKYQALPANLQAIVRDVAQAEYDQVASDFYANDPRALKTLVEEHGVTIHSQFPDDIMEAAAASAKEVLGNVLNSDDDLVRRTGRSFIDSLQLLRTRTENTDQTFNAVRQKFMDYSDL